jgi:class 3 adenylate cyclase
MDRAGQDGQAGQIYLNDALYGAIQAHFRCTPLGEMQFKGTMAPTTVYALQGSEV